MVREDLKERQETADRFYALVKRRMKFGSFCLDLASSDGLMFNKGCYRSRMWSQYAVGHTGACVVFSKNAMVDCVTKHIGPKGILLNAPVTYKNDRKALFDLLFFKPGDEWPDEMTRLLENSQEALFTKVEDFRQEQEFRICYLPEHYEATSAYELVDCSSALAGVIVGSNLHPSYFETICSLARKSSIPAFQCKWLNGAPFIAGIGL